MKKRLWPFLLIVALVLLAAFLTRNHFASNPPVPAVQPLTVGENEAGKVGDVTVTAEALQLAEIRSAPAEVRVVKERLNTSGVIQTGGDQIAKVSPRASGKVVRLMARIGDRVLMGQSLAILESTELASAQAEYRQAVAENRAQESNLTRQRELARLGQFGRPQVEESRSGAVASERDLHEARHHLEEERSALKSAEAEREVIRARWQRTEAIRDLVSRQDQERILADLKKAEADLVAARTRVEAAEGDLRLADKRASISKSALARDERVYAGRHLTTRELVEAETSARMAQVRLEAAAERVALLGGVPGQGSEFALLSPIRGTVQDVSVTLGESVTTERTAFLVVNLDEVWAQLAVTPKDLGKIKVGDPVELTADSAPGRVFQGKISHISSGSDETTRAVYLRAPLKNPEGVLKTNSYVRGSIITEVRHQKLTVPEGALQEHMGRPTLYVALPATGAFEVRHVKLGAKGDRWREISEGLKAGENVAVSGTFYLKSEALKSSLSDGCCGGD